jgi:exodeoxyribonuclease-3
MKIISWNVNGIRSLLKKDSFYSFINENTPDIICLQEVRALTEQFMFDETFSKEYPYQFFNEHSTKKGYSGTAILSNIEPIDVSIADFDTEGRVLVAEYPHFMLVNVYVPNAGSRFEYRVNEWDHLFRTFLISLKKQVIICGDFNVANENIDIHNPNVKKTTAGFTPEERTNFKSLLEVFVDSFRIKNPQMIKYSWWSNMHSSRSKNNGWRIDYFLVSKDLNFETSDILDKVMGSDHAPVVLTL